MKNFSLFPLFANNSLRVVKFVKFAIFAPLMRMFFIALRTNGELSVSMENWGSAKSRRRSRSIIPRRIKREIVILYYLELSADGDNQVSSPRPYFSLSGKIIEETSRVDRVTQKDFYFLLTLTELNSGTGVWFGRELITKQGSRGAIGF